MRTSSRGFLSGGTVSGTTMLWRRTTDLGHQNHRLCGSAAHQLSEFCVPTPLELPSEPIFSEQNRLDKSFLSSSCLFIPCQHFLRPFLLLPIMQDLCVFSTSSYLFTPCVPIQSDPASPLSHTAEVCDVSCACDSGAAQRLDHFLSHMRYSQPRTIHQIYFLTSCF